MPIEDDYRPQWSRGHSPNGPSKAFPKQTTTAQITLGAPIAILNSGIGPIHLYTYTYMRLLHVIYNQIGIESVGWGESVEIAIGFYGLYGGPLDYLGFSAAEPEPLVTTTKIWGRVRTQS